MKTEEHAQGTLGDFRIVREVGRGGMGVVYEAEQISLRRRVALKVLPFAAALDPKQLQRFTNEAQAAAGLHHQNIVPVYGVGFERGVHYFAMQFIDGRTLAVLIDERRSLSGLESHERTAAADSPAAPAVPASEAIPPYVPPLPFHVPPRSAKATGETVPAAALSTEHSARSAEYFRTVARLGAQAAHALEHAHQLGVIHRDVKPANLLVDARGNLWVTDFGLAQIRSDVRLTRTGDLLGTLRYMSPEQALAKPLALDHRTDVYSLGASLYELLTLEPPFPGQDRQALLRQIAFDEPRPLRRINKAIPAELETIVLKAMAKNREERYATAQELADDLERFLKDEPIRARRPTLLQRARKWARRRKPVVVTAALGLLAALTILAGGFGWILRDREARQQGIINAITSALDQGESLQRVGKWPEAMAALGRAQALEARQEADLDAALHDRLRQLKACLDADERDRRFLARFDQVQMELAEVDPEKSRFKSHEAYAKIGAAFQSIYQITFEATAPEQTLALVQERPKRVREQLLAALDVSLGSVPDEQRSTQKWLSGVLRRLDPDPWRNQVRAAVGDRDFVTLSKLLREAKVKEQPPHFLAHALGRLEPSRRAPFVPLMRIIQQSHPGDFWVNSWLGLTLIEGPSPPWPDAVRFLTAAVALRPDSPGAHLNLGYALRHNKDLDGAVAAYRKAILLEPKYLMAHNNLSSVLREKRDLDGAIAAANQLIVLAPQSASGYLSLGVALQEKREVDAALAAYRQAVALEPKSSKAHFNLGSALQAKGKLDEAIVEYRLAIVLHPKDTQAHTNLGVALWTKGEREAGIAELRRAIDLDPKNAKAHANLGGMLVDQGELDAAIPLLEKAVVIDPDEVLGQRNLAVALAGKGRLDGAIAAYEKAVALDPNLAHGDHLLGLELWKRGRPDDAIASFHNVLRIRQDDPDAYYNLAGLHRDKGLAEDAVPFYRSAVAAYEKRVGNASARFNYHMGLALALHDLANLLRGRGEPAEGCQLLEKAVVHQRQAARLDPKNAKLPRYLRNHYDSLAEAYLQIGKHAESAKAAVQLPQVRPGMWQEHYQAARRLALCIPPATQDAQLSEDQRKEAAEGYGNQAIEMLRQAVAGGLKNAAQLTDEPAFAPLRAREDFQKLVAEVRRKK